MSLQTYDARRRVQTPARQAAAPVRQGPSMDALRAGAAVPTQELLGSRVDLPGAIQAKMENAFGADLSGVQLYESQAVADAGAEAVAQGNKIGFAPGRLDFVSHQGHALLGHELSHVVSQARGEVPGSGFLNDRVLEARADREGAMAAAGEQVYSGPVTGSLSSASAASAAGPMQAKKLRTDTKALNETGSKGAYSPASYLSDPVNYTESDPRRQAYLSMAETDRSSATLEQRQAFFQYTNDQAPVNGYLRDPKHFQGDAKASQKQIKQMDALFKQRKGLTEDTTAYRGVGDHFFQFLLSKSGIDPDMYLTDGKVDHDKIRSNHVLDQINETGITYQDQGFVSTSTSRSFADFFPKDQAFSRNNSRLRREMFDSIRQSAAPGPDGAPAPSSLTSEDYEAINKAALHHEMYTPGTHLMNMHLSQDVKGIAIDTMGREADARDSRSIRDEKGQNELLLDRGMNYKVVGIREIVPGRYEMDVEVLTPMGKKRVKKIQEDKKRSR